MSNSSLCKIEKKKRLRIEIAREKTKNTSILVQFNRRRSMLGRLVVEMLLQVDFVENKDLDSEMRLLVH